jgi:uncharacterized alpha-E superfamily protein
MLARIAYQVYWIGRYVARAEFTARMLDGVFQASLQAQRGASRQPLSWDAVMAVMGADASEPGPVPAREAVRALTLDPESPASVTACVDRAREGARTVRDVVSTEMWEALNTLYLELNASDLGAALQSGPYSVYSFVRERCALWWGLADETMLRDGAYFFLGAGRHSESAEMIVRMLRVALSSRRPGTDAASGGDGAVALLQAVGGLEAFRRSTPTPVEPEAVVEFLTFETDYPHSVAASIEALQGALDEVNGGSRGTAPVLRLARLRAELEFHRGLDARAREAAGGQGGQTTGDLLEHIQQELAVVDAEVERRYFTGETPLRQVVSA